MRHHLHLPVLVGYCALASAASAATFTVIDDGDSGAGTLREAITLANAAVDADTIHFDASVTSITLVTALPALTNPATIDGSVNSDYVILNGATNSVVGNGFTLNGNGCALFGMDILGFDGFGVYITGDNAMIGAPAKGNVIRSNDDESIEFETTADNGLVQSNIIGLEQDGITPAANTAGVLLRGTNHQIGGDSASERNVISSAVASNGINILHGSGHRVTGNYIGTDAAGLLDRGNSFHGIYCQVAGVEIGGSGPGEGNLISGNGLRGIQIFDASNAVIENNLIGLSASLAALPNDQGGMWAFGASSNVLIQGNTFSGNLQLGIRTADTFSGSIANNFVGTTPDGTTAVGNGGDGILVDGTGTQTITGNIIGGNTGDGIHLNRPATVSNNYIGTNAAGTMALGNTGEGVLVVANAAGSIIEDNVICRNSEGLFLSGGVTVRDNYIGTNSAGASNLGNASTGVQINSSATGTVLTGNHIAYNATGITVNAANTEIGEPSDGNFIHGNNGYGIFINTAANVVVESNIIGMDSTGLLARPNARSGIQTTGTCTGVQILDNLVSTNGTTGTGSDRYGIRVAADANGAVVQGNQVGTDINGNGGYGNARHGISVLSPATIGGFGAGEGNTVVDNGERGIELSTNITGSTIRGNRAAGNGSAGVYVQGSGGATIQGNLVGLTAAGNAADGNGTHGIEIVGATSTNLIGGNAPQERNVVSGNTDYGILLSAGTTTVRGNYIGTDTTGMVDLGNGDNGIVATASNCTIGGSTASDGNLISGNGGNGIWAQGANNISIQGNTIGLAVDGSDLGNDSHGVGFYATSTTSRVEENVISGNGGHGVYGQNIVNDLTITNNIIGLDPTGTMARGNLDGMTFLHTGDALISNNLISGNTDDGILFSGPIQATVMDNLIGTEVNGTSPLGNADEGIIVNSSLPVLIAGNTIAAHGDNAIRAVSANTTISDNFIGTNSLGATGLGNAGAGVFADAGAINTLINGNLIAGNTGYGIRVTNDSTASSNTLTGNFGGIEVVTGGGNNLIGGAGDGNTFSSHTGDHVRIGAGSTGNTISTNSFDGASSLTISFAGSLIANDPLDTDTGANNQQNHPVLDALDDAAPAVTGVLESLPNTTYTIEVYSSSAAHASGFGPGQAYLGSTTATTNGSGTATWSLATGPQSAGTVLTGLGTSPSGDTSHFSPAVTVTVSSGVVDWQVVGQD